ncbi:MAG TPA: histidinol-phosphate transaminase [Alphaproteobacteria bacterium]|nr:histidinol-phosphate transaminase [Alphaproteobacteria bacterium]
MANDNKSPLTPQPGIMGIAPYVPGEHGLAGHNRVRVLSANENPLGAGAAARDAYLAGVRQLERYPDGSHRKLREAIARADGLEADRIVCGAGSDELLGMLGKAYAGVGDEIVYSAHGFTMYPIIAQSVGARSVPAPEQDLTADVEALLAAVTPRTKILFLANPNNPTGTYLPMRAVRNLRARLREDILLVLDAAYVEYVTADDYGDPADLVRETENTVMCRTFSKIHGLAAVRLGWCYAPAAVVGVLNRVRGPFNVSVPALLAGEAAIVDKGHQERSRAHNSQWLPWLTEQLRGLGLEVPPSQGNFLLVRFPTEPGKDAAAAIEHLNAHGIIPRRMGGYGLPDSLRITIGLEEDNRAVLDALREFVG